MKNKMIGACITAALFLVSCKSTAVDVVIDQAGEDSVQRKIAIDGKTILRFSGDSTAVVKLTPGDHFVQLNDSAKRNFTVTENGGILNLDNEEYVVFDLKYKAVDGSSDMTMPIVLLNGRVTSVVVIDSFLVFPRAGRQASSDSVLREMLPRILAGKSAPRDPKTDAFTSVLRLTGKGSLFIPKDWDYNMTDSIPETISVNQSEIVGHHTTILRSRIFLFGLLLSPDQEAYTVKSISDIREGANDKKAIKEDEPAAKERQDKIKADKKKQMAF